MEHLAVVLVAGLVIAHGSVSSRLERAPVTPPLVFLAAGLLLGADGVGLVGLDVDHGVLDVLAEVTLVLVLFTDASRLDLTRLRGQAGLPVRMLGIGLPLTMLAGAGAAALLLDGLDGWALLVLGAVLAPTDATLGQAVVSDHRVPVRIRQTLNVESGLNDGLALPAVTLAAAAAAGEFGGGGGALGYLAQQIGVGVLVGIALGWSGGRLVDARVRAGDMSPTAQQLVTMAVALAGWGLAEVLGGNGFVAAFVAGMAFGAVARERCERVVDFAEEEGQLLVLLTFLLVGATLVGPALAAATPARVAYALVSLTLVRMLPMAVALVGSGLRWQSVAFLGWFGPRGLASIIFGLLVVEQAGVSSSGAVLDVVVLTATLSVVLHGVSAAPLAARYGAWASGMHRDAPERAHAPELLPRIRFGRTRRGTPG